MKIFKMFLGITLVVSIMIMLIGCDVFDPKAEGQLGTGLSHEGKLVDAFNDEAAEQKDGDIPDLVDPSEPLANVPKDPDEPGEEPSGPDDWHPNGDPPKSDFIFFPEPSSFGHESAIYVVIKKEWKIPAGSPVDPIDDLYVLADEGPLTAIKNKYYPDATIGNSSGMADTKTLIMEKGPTHPVDPSISNAEGFFWLKIPANLKSFTRKDWVTYNGFRMEFVNRSAPDNWDNSRISFDSTRRTKCGAYMTKYTKNSFIADPYVPTQDDYGQYYQMRLNFSNENNWYTIPPTD